MNDLDCYIEPKIWSNNYTPKLKKICINPCKHYPIKYITNKLLLINKWSLMNKIKK